MTPVELAREVLHWNRCRLAGCSRCYVTNRFGSRVHRFSALRTSPQVTLANALLKALKVRP